MAHFKLTVELNTGNAAFAEHAHEIDRILSVIIDRIAGGSFRIDDKNPVWDSNGNNVGYFTVEI